MSADESNRDWIADEEWADEVWERIADTLGELGYELNDRDETETLVRRFLSPENLISEEMVELFRQAWEQANSEGDVGNRVRRGLHAALGGGS